MSWFKQLDREQSAIEQLEAELLPPGWFLPELSDDDENVSWFADELFWGEDSDE